MTIFRRLSWLVGLFTLITLSVHAQSDDTTTTIIATDLQNPRGVAVLPDGLLIVAEAGTGFVGDYIDENTGQLRIFEDLNDDGDFNDLGERIPIVDRLTGYNMLEQFQPGRDEVVGIGDVIVLEDGRIFYTLDNHFYEVSVIAVSPDYRVVGTLYVEGSTINALAFDPATETIYMTLSSFNTIGAVTLDGDSRTVAIIPPLAHGQQAVPSGLALDPLTGDLLVTLFSGNLWDYYGEILSFMPGDSKVVRVNPATGTIEDVVTNLTTAVDVATDEQGNIYVVQLTTEWPTPTIDTKFDLYNPDGSPDAGGYMRYSGRVTMYPVDSSEPIILAEDLDAPTNVTYYDGALYVSVGQGTPDRPIWVDGELRYIVGEIIKIPVQTESENAG